MLLSKTELALTAFASKEESHYSLQCIAVEKDVTVATNGHYLVTVAHTSDTDEGFPKREGIVPAYPNGKPVLLSLDCANAALKALPKKESIVPYLANALLAENSTLVVTNVNNTQTFAGHVEGTFPPNWPMVIPKGKPKAQIALNAGYLKQIAAFFEKYGRDDVAPVRLTIYDDSTAMRFDCRTEDGREMMAVLMPIRMNSVDFAKLPHEVAAEAKAKKAEEAKAVDDANAASDEALEESSAT